MRVRAHDDTRARYLFNLRSSGTCVIIFSSRGVLPLSDGQFGRSALPFLPPSALVHSTNRQWAGFVMAGASYCKVFFIWNFGTRNDQSDTTVIQSPVWAGFRISNNPMSTIRAIPNRGVTHKLLFFKNRVVICAHSSFSSLFPLAF